MRRKSKNDITVEDAIYMKIDWLIQIQYECLPYETIFFIKGDDDDESEDD